MKVFFCGNGYRTVIGAVLLVLLWGLPATGADRLYFVPLVEKSLDTHQSLVTLEWGPLEGSIPEAITEFRVYRSVNGGAFSPAGRIPHKVVDADELRQIILGDHNKDRTGELIGTLQQICSGENTTGTVDESNFHIFLRNRLDPGHPDFNALQRMLLIRRFPGVAQAAGMAWVDADTKPGETCMYLLTAITDAGKETLPLGKTSDVDPSVATVLPAPEQFQTVRVGQCSEIRSGLDDFRIHFNWYVPMKPNEIGLRVGVYGYDLFWSASDLGPVDLRDKIPEELHRVNTTPILVAGSPPAEGPDSFLARDDGETHLSGPEWKRGQVFYYYLGARDLIGGYSEIAGPLKAIVVDARPPATPWNVHTQEIKDRLDSGTPRLALVWDQVNSANYLRHYGMGKTICSASDEEICYAGKDGICAADSGIRCRDLAVDHYDIYRFASPEAASRWGLDADGDRWPDIHENKAGTDPCDPVSHPAGDPVEFVAAIDHGDVSHQKVLAPNQVQMTFVDQAVAPDNTVYWYRIVAVDRSGNRSPVSPPVRGVLFDRSQPEPNGEVLINRCGYTAKFEASCGSENGILKLIDTNKSALTWVLLQYCPEGTTGKFYTPLLQGTLSDGVAVVNGDCTIDFPECAGAVNNFVVMFYDDLGAYLATSDPFSLESLCKGFSGCVTLEKECQRIYHDPGQVLDYGDTVRVCANLENGQSARIYHRIGGRMSPLSSIPAAATVGTYCVDLNDLEGIVPADLCLGVRIFSRNHVGSAMQYIDCLEMESADEAPPVPLIEGVHSFSNDAGEPVFEVRWASPGPGVAAFILTWENGSDVRYSTVWDALPDESGQYSHTLSLAEEDLNRDWCFRMRSVDTAMRRSPWSAERCGTWEVTAPESLGWPPVAEPATVEFDETNPESLTAFFLRQDLPDGIDGVPVVVLSGDKSEYLAALGCQEGVRTCSGSPCIQEGPSPFEYGCTAICDAIHGWRKVENFIVYRQEEGRDFVQVGPLIEGFNCYLVNEDVQKPDGDKSASEKYTYSILDDPGIYVVDIRPGAIDGIDAGLEGNVSGVRVIFPDRYPYIAGTRVRFQVVNLNTASGEPETVYTTNWVAIP